MQSRVGVRRRRDSTVEAAESAAIPAGIAGRALPAGTSVTMHGPVIGPGSSIISTG
jgi:hypothetical protein